MRRALSISRVRTPLTPHCIHPQRNKLPKWIGQYIKESDTNLATDVAIAHSKRFLRMMAQPFEQSTKSLWGIEEVRVGPVRLLLAARSRLQRANSGLYTQILDKQRGLDPERDVNEDALALEAEAEAAAAAQAEADAAAAADDEAYAAQQAQQAQEQEHAGKQNDVGGDVAMGEPDADDPEDDPFKEIDDAALAEMDMADLPQPPPAFFGAGGFDEAGDAEMGGFELPMPPQEFRNLDGGDGVADGEGDDEGLVLPQPPPEFL